MEWILRRRLTCAGGPEPKRILALCLSHLGDLVLLTPLFANLRLQFPTSHIAAVSKSVVADILRNHPAIDEVITYEARWILGPGSRRAGLLDSMRLIRTLRAGSFDLLIIGYDHPADRLLGMCTGIKAQVSLEADGIQRCGIPAAGAPVGHRVEHAFDLLRALDVPIVDAAPSLGVTAADVAWAGEWLREQSLVGKKILGVHPGSGGPRKCWPAARFARVAEELAGTDGYAVVVTGSPVDAEPVQEFTRVFRGKPARPPLTLTVGQLCALIQRFSVLLCNDCGPMHIAAALRVPVIAVFGPSSPALWGPYPRDPRHVVVAAPDGQIESITPEEVLAALAAQRMPACSVGVSPPAGAGRTA
jgi:ADP-heptose:LPS heptosyltransferase